ncbi:hypothetical protein pb186bvf_006301 [Paramecium bursaria]
MLLKQEKLNASHDFNDFSAKFSFNYLIQFIQKFQQFYKIRHNFLKQAIQ